MKKHLKNITILSILACGLITPQYNKANAKDIGEFFLIAGAITAATGLACYIFRWSDTEIVKWAKKGTDKLNYKYAPLRGTWDLLLELRNFGILKQTPYSYSRENNIIHDNPALFPFHNTLEILKNDLYELKNYQKYLIDRNLLDNNQCSYFYVNLVNLIGELENLKLVVLLSGKYGEEALLLNQYLDDLITKELHRERNRALREQARQQHEHNLIILDKQQNPNPVVINNNIVNNNR